MNQATLSPLLSTLLILITVACSGNNDPPGPAAPGEESSRPNPIALTSAAFEDGARIPTQYTCDGADEPPPLAWEHPGVEIGSYALVVDDPDAPRGAWVHWVQYNIPTDVTVIPAGDGSLPGISGVNSWGRSGYAGPCPPSGTHRYFFRLYALDTNLNLGSEADKAAVLEAMQDHVLASGELMGTYGR